MHESIAAEDNFRLVSSFLFCFTRSLPISHGTQVRTLMEKDSPNLIKAYRIHLSEEKGKLAIMGVLEESNRGVGHEELDFAGRETVTNERKGVELSGSRKLRYVAGYASEAS